MISKQYLRELIKDYKEAEETGDYDSFQEIYGDVDDLIYCLIRDLEGLLDKLDEIEAKNV